MRMRPQSLRRPKTQGDDTSLPVLLCPLPLSHSVLLREYPLSLFGMPAALAPINEPSEAKTSLKGEKFSGRGKLLESVWLRGRSSEHLKSTLNWPPIPVAFPQ